MQLKFLHLKQSLLITFVHIMAVCLSNSIYGFEDMMTV